MIHLYKDMYITADSSQFILFHKNISKSGKNKGKEVFSKHTYHPTIDLLMRNLFHQAMFDELKTEDKKNLKFMVKRFKKLTNVLKTLSDKIGNTKNLYKKLSSEKEEYLDDDIIEDDEIIEDDDEEILT